ncbi:hypothetical protein MJO29_016018 [Puccinia striiformis f. sp. tritici]|nr:hypothetical protein MJO29_016018 [Puccinia striiformis f. sp. tritici]
MLASPHHLVLVTLLTGAWLARITLAEVSCDPTITIDRKQCAQAISQIVYDKPKDTLDRFSTVFAKLSGNCTIIVENYNKDVVTKQQIEAGYASIFNKCQTKGGINSLPNLVGFRIHDHRTFVDDLYFPPRTLTCGLNTNAPLTVEKDCQDAFKSFPVDGQGRMLDDDHQPADFLIKTSKTCTVNFYTTDNSPIIVKKSEIEPVVTKMIKSCQGKSGVIGMTKGGSGKNGFTLYKVRSSKPCYSPANPDTQNCR